MHKFDSLLRSTIVIISISVLKFLTTDISNKKYMKYNLAMNTNKKNFVMVDSHLGTKEVTFVISLVNIFNR